MENCPLDKLPPTASEEEMIETCENCILEECVLDDTEDVPFSYDEAYVKCLNCKDVATLWLENNEVEQVIKEHSKPSTKKGVKRERTFTAAGKYYSKEGKIYHRCYEKDSECKVISIRKGERP